MRGGSLLLFFALVLFFPLPSDQIGGGFLVCYFFLPFFFSFFFLSFCTDGMEREACVCDHGFERSDLCVEIIISIIIGRSSVCRRNVTRRPSSYHFVAISDWQSTTYSTGLAKNKVKNTQIQTRVSG